MRTLLPEGWAPPIGYANGIEVDAGRIVFIAGQVGWDAQQKFQSVEITPQFEQALTNVLAVLAEWHGALAGEPGRELLVGLHEPVAPDAHQDRPQPIQHIVGPIRLRGDLGIEPNHGLTQVALDQHLLGQAAKVLRREVVPTKA